MNRTARRLAVLGGWAGSFAALTLLPGFDAGWYALVSARRRIRPHAVAHYLWRGRRSGLTPHPLFDPAYHRASGGARRSWFDPYAEYLLRTRWRAVPTHPLFDLAGYLEQAPDARSAPGGPPRHYVRTGSRRGLRPNAWLSGTALDVWLREQARVWVAHESTAPTATITADDRPVSVVLPASPAWADTVASADDLLVARLRGGTAHEIVLVAHADGDLVGQAVVASLAERHDDVRMLVAPADVPGATTTAWAAPATLLRGATVVLLTEGVRVESGWLEPLVHALAADPTVLGVQSVSVHRSGSVSSAGVVAPCSHAGAHLLLHGFPMEDAAALDDVPLWAVAGGAVALRRRDLLAATTGWPTAPSAATGAVDLCRTVVAGRPGGFAVAVASTVRLREDRAGACCSLPPPAEAWLADRVAAVEDDAERVWGTAGFRLRWLRVGEGTATAAGTVAEVAIAPGLAVVRATAPARSVAPTLRWVLKNPAPAGPAGRYWGDTHFLECLAAALRRLGQEVVVDARGEFDRPSGTLDDVVLVLRGLVPHRPRPGQLSLLWVISHPEQVTAEEAAPYDRVFAASTAWAQARSREWGRRVEPLLQCTDPARFHPGRAEPDTGPAVVYVGGSRGELRPALRAALEAHLPVAVYGRGWEGLVPAALRLGDYVDNDELGRLYRGAGVVLADHWGDMARDGFLANRLFDAVASGGRVVSDEVTGLAEVFGDDVAVWRSAGDLARLAGPGRAEAFGDDAARREAAARVAAEHSFAARAQTLLDAAVEGAAGRPVSG